MYGNNGGKSNTSLHPLVRVLTPLLVFLAPLVIIYAMTHWGTPKMRAVLRR